MTLCRQPEKPERKKKNKKHKIIIFFLFSLVSHTGYATYVVNAVSSVCVNHVSLHNVVQVLASCTHLVTKIKLKTLYRIAAILTQIHHLFSKEL